MRIRLKLQHSEARRLAARLPSWQPRKVWPQQHAIMAPIASFTHPLLPAACCHTVQSLEVQSCCEAAFCHQQPAHLPLASQCMLSRVISLSVSCL